MAASSFTLLDGGMGKLLHANGAPFQQPEWSALSLMQSPAHVVEAHQQFIDAGADVLITSNYAVVPYHLGDDVFDARCEELVDLAGRLARDVADGAPRPVQVAGSLPPLFGSYEPENFDPERAPALLDRIVEAHLRDLANEKPVTLIAPDQPRIWYRFQHGKGDGVVDQGIVARRGDVVIRPQAVFDFP